MLNATFASLEDRTLRAKRRVEDWRRGTKTPALLFGVRALRRGLAETADAILATRKALFSPARERACDALFIVGVQRSGTTILAETLGRSLETSLFDEDHPRAFDDFRLLDRGVVSGLISRERGRVAVFKPICDSHNVLTLLSEHSRSKALWIFRAYADAVNSAVKLWGDHAKWRFDRMLRDRESAGWWAENLSEDAFEMVRRHYRPEMSPHAAYALRWYIRNGLVFELGLTRRTDVLLVSYDRLMREPATEFRRVFDFIDCTLEARLLSDLHDRSIRKEPLPPIPDEIRELCERRTVELDQAERDNRDALAASNGSIPASTGDKGQPANLRSR